MKRFTFLCIAGLALAGCGQDASNSAGLDEETVLRNPTAVAALSEGEAEPMDEVPQGDPQGAAEEELAGADEQPLVPRDCSLLAVRERVKQSYDTDGDGTLSRDEKEAIKDSMTPDGRRGHRYGLYFRLQRIIWVYDIDKSGDLSDAERATLEQDLEARCAARQALLLEKFDTDDNGTLSDSEWQAAHDALVAKLAERRAERIAEVDSNDDGQISEQERIAARAERREHIREHRSRVAGQYDADDDGELDDTERDALRADLRSRVRGEHLEG